MKKTLVLALTVGLLGSLHASNTANSKDIQVVSTSQVNSPNADLNTNRGELFHFAKAASKKVKVGEPIKLALKLKEKSYIYMIAVSNKNDKAYMILPNKFEGYNLYKPNTHYVVPERSADYQFISDSAGTETIYLIASTHKQKFESLLNQFGTKEVGGFRTTSVEKAHKFMKDIIVVSANRLKKKVEVRKLNVEVYDDKPVETPSNTSAVGSTLENTSGIQVFVSTGKSHYKMGETVATMLQSDHDGYVSLFIQNPDKSHDYIDTRKVLKGKAETLKLKAQGDSGAHEIIVYFNESKPEKPETLINTEKQKNVKALQLVTEAPVHTPVNSHTVILTDK